jgi:Flp pilus assembly pilin Flp
VILADVSHQLFCEYDSYMIRVLEEESGQGMVEYLLIVSLVVLTIVGLLAGLMHLFSRT